LFIWLFKSKVGFKLILLITYYNLMMSFFLH
jgi:hypothetical protein